MKNMFNKLELIQYTYLKYIYIKYVHTHNMYIAYIHTENGAPENCRIYLIFQ